MQLQFLVKSLFSSSPSWMVECPFLLKPSPQGHNGPQVPEVPHCTCCRPHWRLQGPCHRSFLRWNRGKSWQISETYRNIPKWMVYHWKSLKIHPENDDFIWFRGTMMFPESKNVPAILQKMVRQNQKPPTVHSTLFGKRLSNDIEAWFTSRNSWFTQL